RCTGSIIAPRFVLTAGHCAFAEEVHVGSTDFANGSVTVRVREAHKPPGFNITKDANGRNVVVQGDIAILELEEALTFTHAIRPICLPLKFKEAYGDVGFIAGWGRHDEKLENGSVVIPHSRDALLRDAAVTFHRCHCDTANLEDNDNVTDAFVHPANVICAGGMGSGVNHGDSGGPLMVAKEGVWYQVGVASYIDKNHPLRQDLHP
ncbi:serine protease, partial [Aphelenchoides avenae]